MQSETPTPCRQLLLHGARLGFKGEPNLIDIFRKLKIEKFDARRWPQAGMIYNQTYRLERQNSFLLSTRPNLISKPFASCPVNTKSISYGGGGALRHQLRQENYGKNIGECERTCPGKMELRGDLRKGTLECRSL